MGSLWQNLVTGTNLLELARSPQSGWRHNAARGLLALELSEPSVEASPEALFFQAAACWIDGDVSAAITLLDKLELPAAVELRRLIAKDRIDILSFLPRGGKFSGHNLVEVENFDPQFRIRNVSYAEIDISNGADLCIEDLIQGQRPDFILAEMIEWQILPRDLQNFTGPIIGHTSDFDVHIQASLPYLRLFDFVMTAGGQEWRKLARLIGAEYTQPFPLPFSIPDMPPVLTDLRQLDLIMTGTVFSPSQRDKERVIKQIADIPGLNYVLVNGSMLPQHYLTLLGAAKLTLSFIRHVDSMPTRALEALAAGCCCLVTPDNVLNLYIPEGHGLISADYADPDDLRRKVLAVTRDAPERFATEVAQGAALVRKLFSKARISPIYMRFCTVIAAMIASGDIPRRAAPRPITQKRPVSWVGWLPNNGERKTLDSLLRSNQILAQQAKHREAYWRLNEMGRNAILDHELWTRWKRPDPGPALVTEALNAFRQAMAAAPAALAPAVNFLRAAYHHGGVEERSEADATAAAILARPREGWRLDPEDDLLTYDFHQNQADTRRFIDLITIWEAARILGGAQEDAACAVLIDALLATVHLYLGWRHEALESYRMAVALAPDFLEGRVGLARALVETGEQAALHDARGYLADVSANYVFSTEIAALDARAARLLGQSVESTTIQANLGYRTLDLSGEYYADFEGVAHATNRRFVIGSAEIRVRPSNRKPIISVIVLDRHRDQRDALAMLDQANCNTNSEIEFIDCEIFASIGDNAPDWCDIAVRPLSRPTLIEHRGRILTLGFRQATADILVFAERLDGVSLDHFTGAARHLLTQPEAIVARAWPEAGAVWPQIVMLRRDLFTRLRGFDFSTACQGQRGGVRELVWRARNAGTPIIDLGDKGLKAADWANDLSLSQGSLAPIATLLQLTEKPDWDNASRIRPFWPARDLI